MDKHTKKITHEIFKLSDASQKATSMRKCAVQIQTHVQKFLELLQGRIARPQNFSTDILYLQDKLIY